MAATKTTQSESAQDAGPSSDEVTGETTANPAAKKSAAKKTAAKKTAAKKTTAKKATPADE